MKSRRDRNMGKSSKVSYATEVMNPQIWRKFPQDLFEVVLSRLPIATIICFRAVCKEWNNLITSKSFSQQCAKVSQVNPWFCITFGYNNYGAMYDPFMKKWYNGNRFENPILSVSSAGGLVCFADKHTYDRNLYVCNPMTQSFNKLPKGSIEMWRLSGMTMNGSAGYKVLKLGYDREYEIYDSVIKCWSHLEKIPECVKEHRFIISNHVSFDNTLYFKHTSPKGIVSCDTSTGVWTQQLIQAPLHSSDLTLVESDGWIMVVGLVTENDACVCIWEVEKMNFLLKEVDRVSFSEFFSRYGRPVSLTCMGNKGMLLCCLNSRNMYRMITYNIASRKWEKVREPDGRRLRNQNSVEGGTAFQPCLTAMP